MDRYQIAIIGTGPAGLEAAITAKIRNKKILLIGDKNLSAKVEKAHTVENYLGLPAITGTDLQASFQRHLEQMEIDHPGPHQRSLCHGRVFLAAGAYRPL